MKRALICQTRVPEIDRDSGSQQVDLYLRWLTEAGWSVSFAAINSDGEERHERRLRQSGIATYVGEDSVRELLANERFDLALLAFWEPASRLLPLLRETSPRSRVIVDTVDIHFLREARRSFASGVALDDGFGRRLVGELNTYREADAVLTVSASERELLTRLMGGERIHELPLAKPVVRSLVPFDERSGMFFAGNFRHVPNGEAVEFLCHEVLPLVAPELLAANPLTVVGSRLDEKVRAHARGLPGVSMVGWVPSVRPYLERARICLAPLLHGAGVKGKIVEALLAGTPVITTPVGAEGIELRSGENAIIASSPPELAKSISRLLTDRAQWERLADAGHDLAYASYSPEHVGTRFLEIVNQVMEEPPRELEAATLRRSGRRERAYRTMVQEVRRALGELVPAGARVAVVSRGDEELVSLPGIEGWHVPRQEDGRWVGHHPADGAEAIAHVEGVRDRGAGWLAIPAATFWWLDHYEELREHLERSYRRVRANEHLVVYALGSSVSAPPAKPGRVRIVGFHAPPGTRPPVDSVAALGRSERFEIEQSWTAAAAEDLRDKLPEQGDPDAEWTVFVSDRAILPEHFLDDFLRLATILADQGVQRVQPTHVAGPEVGAPATERLRGVIAREIPSTTPLPVLAVRGGARTEGPTALLDGCPIDIRGRLPEGDPIATGTVWDVFGARAGIRRTVRRSQGSGTPLVSVLIATHERPELLRRCLQGFCDQTLSTADFEVVVVDDGSLTTGTAAVIEEFASRLTIVATRIEHSGRSAAKNLATMLARGDAVLIFDDDDVPAPELLEAHLRAHALDPAETVAILGHTEWAPDLHVTPLMHYLTEVGRLMFSYGNLSPGERYGWRCFWEGRISVKRSLLLRHGLHDQRLDYSIDVELGWRLARHGLEVVYAPDARSFMARPIDFSTFCERSEAKGRAGARIAALHESDELVKYAGVSEAEDRWREWEPRLPELEARAHDLEAAAEAGGTESLEELHTCYRDVFAAYTAKGLATAAGAQRPTPAAFVLPRVEKPHLIAPSNGASGAAVPELSVAMPVWSRTEELAEMAAETVDRVWEVARVATEVVIVDNGSPVPKPMRGQVYRFESNYGVAAGWNIGVALTRAPFVAVLNSDCLVEDGWDEALLDALAIERRIAFPFTDHRDGRGFRRPDQAGTAGWCFAMARETYEEVGPFDERFSPAYCEDTDYWHRAWELGVDLVSVPEARVTHARRTSAEGDFDSRLLGHRFIYGWKHGVDPLRAPPYYHRQVIEHEVRPSRTEATP